MPGTHWVPCTTCSTRAWTAQSGHIQSILQVQGARTAKQQKEPPISLISSVILCNHFNYTWSLGNMLSCLKRHMKGWGDSLACLPSMSEGLNSIPKTERKKKGRQHGESPSQQTNSLQKNKQKPLATMWQKKLVLLLFSLCLGSWVVKLQIAFFSLAFDIHI